MVNRNLEVKRLKIKRRGKYVRLSGGDTKIRIGEVSFSKQVINVGLRVPGLVPAKHSLNRERMREINPRKDLISELKKSLQFPVSEDQAVRARVLIEEDQNLDMKKLIFNGRSVKVYLFFDIGLKNIYLIRFDFRLNLVQKSCQFTSLEQAQDVLSKGIVPWIVSSPSD